MNWFAMLYCALWPPVFALIWRRVVRIPSRPDRLAWPWLGASLGQLLAQGLAGDWPAFGVSAGNALIALGIWWWRSGKRKSAAEMLGAKSRARRDALVRKVRESAKPRPVLKPAPGGAR